MTQSQSSSSLPVPRQERDPRLSPDRRPTRHAAIATAHERDPRGRRERPGRRIIDQLRLIVAVPLVAVVVFAGIALVTTVQQVNRSRQLQDFAALASDAGGLAHALQRERAAAVNVLLNPAPAQLEAYSSQVMITDDNVEAYRDRRAGISEVPDSVRRVDSNLADLANLRDQVRKDARASVSGIAFSYRILIADLLSYRESVARSGAPTELADQIRAAAALSRAAEALGQQQAAVLRAVAAGELTPALQQEITATRTSFVEATVQFNDLAPAEWRSWYEQASTGEQVIAAQRLQDQVNRARPGQQFALITSDWINAMSGWSGLLFGVQQKVDDAIVEKVGELRDQQMTQAAIQIAGVALVLLIAIVLTGIVARRITRRLRALHDAAREVAYEQLPAVVAELRAAAPGTVDPDEVADRASAKLVVGGADEVADVAQAFRAVHREAVRIAGEQAVMRSNVAEIFVHLSRREQRLVDAVLAQVDRVERDETDPDRLQQLYQLDHLATRMARINLSLLVLGGSGAARVRREDAPMGKVLQAAISQIEHYTRVRFGSVDDDVAVVAEAVDEIVHLLAELLDNATGYSPPESEVWVTGRALGDRVILQIVDEGVGLAPSRRDQLNQLLAQPPAIDIAAVRAMGLTVVGHIAARYQILVQLRPGQHGGTLAEVVIPKDVFRPIMAAERQPQLAPAVIAGPPAGYSTTAGGNGNGSGGGGAPARPVAAELFTPAPRTAPPSLFDVPTQEYRVASPSPAADYTQDYSQDQTQSFAAVQDYAPPRDHRTATPMPPGPGAWPPLPEPEVPSILADADDSIELPIFQSVNGWFRTTEVPAEVAVPSAYTVAAVPVAEEPPNWESSADAGWRAAQQAATPDVSTVTASGLPVRAPQRHLVPGAAVPSQADRSTTPRRDPSKVAAAMSAYARGVAGRRPAGS
ncbi:nitrate- and nitrite sensing domain-containing protein [Dactylosporangium sp. NPDC049525]|uniref:sensor histidine kinase n=1 Tax=Dactylosporangium sp. NPDC049525 TaxID=3154730 RepID=UPI00341EFFEA